MNYVTVQHTADTLKHVTPSYLLQSPALHAESNLQHDLKLCVYKHSSITCSNTHRVWNIRSSVCMIKSLEWDQMVIQELKLTWDCMLLIHTNQRTVQSLSHLAGRILSHRAYQLVPTAGFLFSHFSPNTPEPTQMK